MTGILPDLTLFVGPQSCHGLALNQVVRDGRAAMGPRGLAAFPTRLATPALRALTDPNATLDARRRSFDALSHAKPAFYSALSFLGAAHKSLGRAEVLREGGGQLGALAEVAGGADFRLIFALDNLPDLVLAAGSDVLEARVRDTPWEQLYEIGWTDLIMDAQAAFPGADIVVLTHSGTALGGEGLVDVLFGAAADASHARDLLRGSLNATGQAVLDRMGDGVPPEAVARDLYRSFADRADPAICRERLGLDRLTRSLLLRRFDEDIERIAALDGVEVV